MKKNKQFSINLLILLTHIKARLPMKAQYRNTQGAIFNSNMRGILKKIAQQNLNMSEHQLLQFLNEQLVDRLMGCFFGGLVGDALGSYCQFKQKSQCSIIVNEALKMPGGGPFNIKSGQITDDSEMAMHLLKGLLTYNGQKTLKDQCSKILVNIAKQYIKWNNSIPFDIGQTCRSGIQKLQKQLGVEQEGEKNDINQFQKFRKALKEIEEANSNKLSNGFLMKISPLLCFITLYGVFHKNDIQKQVVDDLIKGQISMTHPNKSCVQAAFHFIRINQFLINRDSHAYLTRLKKILRKKKANSEEVGSSGIGEAYKDFVQHSQNVNNQKVFMDAVSKMGFFKIAYYYTFYCFFQVVSKCEKYQDLNPQVFKECMKLIIQQGGDTDTNACIAGILLGSIFGFKNLPQEYLQKLLELKLGDSEYRKYQEEYEPVKGFVNMVKLIRKFKEH